ncbi:LysR family transcriptional regulator [Nereida sp. MMG025]|uniref:LysR family transcriptional regulator n=1 Tax=Nereida sp. MMG025 TaxID=2909981 RepID=UPI001F48EC89|nr:LysR family transcriptional regulator [Nereida sp. MMG025]MCF6445778.1 LysR family transcriptional regulator [Nereida sp. MMG025]
MNPDDLIIFLAVARTGSISAAAVSVGKDPATVGRRIQRLEDVLGTSLFSKSPRGYVLTDDGNALSGHAAKMENVLTEISSDFLNEDTSLTGRIRIGAPDGCATFLLPDILAQISAAHPELVIEVVSASRDFDVLNRDVDLAISVTPSKSKALLSEPLADYHLQFAAAHKLVDRVGQDALKDQPLISYIPELLMDPELDMPAHFRTRAPKLRSNSVLVQWEWIKHGHGIGMVHDFALRDQSAVTRIFPEFSVPRQYFLNLRKDEMAFRRMATLATLLRRQFAQALSA